MPELINWSDPLSWTTFLSVCIAFLSLGFALWALRLSKSGKKIAHQAHIAADKAVTATQKYFVSTNRPYLILEPMRFGDDESFLKLNILNNHQLHVATMVQISNIGPIVAQNVSIHKANAFLIYNNSMVAKVTIDSKNSLESVPFMEIAPNKSVIKNFEYQFELPSDWNAQEFSDNIKNANYINQHILTHYYSSLKKKSAL